MNASVLTGPALFCIAVLLAAGAGASADDTQQVGIQQRVPWTTSRLTGSPDPPAPFQLERVFAHLTFENPVVLTGAPRSERLFLAELNGRVFSFPVDSEGTQPDLFVDLKEAAGSDRVYGLTFHPDFPQTPYCYACYTVAPDHEEGTHVARFEVDLADPPRLRTETRQVLLKWPSGGHNGGCLKFGPDGYLYISTGDGGPAFPPDPRKSGQDVSNLLSCILRIDVDHSDGGRPYRIPGDNPFVDLPDARGEIWAYGFRNPWKMSFDKPTGSLWVGDVGWELWEMIYRVERGANYGWSLVEGPQPVHQERTRGPTPIVPPTIEHSHIEARSITGGFVYRGERLPELEGAYVYGDYVTGKLWAARHDGRQVTARRELADTTLQIICFGVDHRGELYVVGYDGTLHRLIRNRGARANEAFPRRLSETGLFASVPSHEVAPGVIPYSINAEPWMDGARAERYVALPGRQSLGIYDSTNVQIGYIEGRWRFPTDGVLMKTISLEMERGRPASARRLETQVLHFDVDTWRAYNYVWNESQTDAVLAEGPGRDQRFTVQDPAAPGGTREINWHFASRSECLLCHSTRGGSIYGFHADQLRKQHDYDGVRADQLATLEHIGLFEELESLPNERIVDPYDSAAELDSRARAYLHVNCAHCHRRGGGGTAAMDIQYHFALKRTNLLDARPTQGTFGIHRAEVLVPGDPYRSVLYYRMAKLGRGRMPYFGSDTVDARGLRLIHDWIASLDGKPPGTVPKPWLAALKQDPRGKRIDDQLSDTSRALRLLSALDRGGLPPPLAQRVIRHGSQHADMRVRDLFERFLPVEKRTRRLGRVVDASKILKLPGDARRGRQLFLKGDGIQCRNCHRLENVGTPLGPDLAKRPQPQTDAQLLESILDPSRKIEPRYMPQLVETTSGRVHLGLLVASDEQAVVLKTAENKELRIAREEIETLLPQRKSIMPELLVQDMTAQQVADLIAYLQSL